MLGVVWVDRPSEPDHSCDVCKHGADQGVGPFWQGPRRATGNPGFGRKQMGRFHVCRECLFVIVNHPDSPFHGLIPAGEAARSVAEQADRHIARLRERIGELEQREDTPDALVNAAVAAAIDELEARGAFDKPAPEAPKPARKQAAKPKAA
jgi:hypothetical protein